MPRRYPASFDRRRFGRDAYERAFAGVDSWLGELLGAVGDDTLVVFTGDHGENTRPRAGRFGDRSSTAGRFGGCR